ncbi:hypothetical protein BDZ97DRAFT_947087 [Flammula alnicola]|nr:hypothetical protein BDZ97DRAFT_947087 [Flammula alnicola]
MPLGFSFPVRRLMPGLKLLRTPNTGEQLGPDRANEIHALISQTADSYEDASRYAQSTVSIAASYHARFLRSLVENDIFKSRRGERERIDSSMPIDPRLQGPVIAHGTIQNPPSQVYSHQVHRMQEQTQQTFHFPASPNLPAHPHQGPRDHEYHNEIQARTIGNGPSPAGNVHYPGGYIPTAPHSTELDARYWKNMFIELGFGENDAPIALQSVVLNNIPPRFPSIWINTVHLSDTRLYPTCSTACPRKPRCNTNLCTPPTVINHT